MFIILGLVIVGMTDALYQTSGESKGRNSLITGDLLIIIAQVVSACQMVYEEKYVTGEEKLPFYLYIFLLVIMILKTSVVSVLIQLIMIDQVRTYPLYRQSAGKGYLGFLCCHYC